MTLSLVRRTTAVSLFAQGAHTCSNNMCVCVCCQTINRIQNKSFCLHNMCVYCVYLLCNVYINTHMHVYIQEKYVDYILNIFIYYMNINIYMYIFSKYVGLLLYVCVCVYIYIYK